MKKASIWLTVNTVTPSALMSKNSPFVIQLCTNKIGNYELHRLLEKVPNSGEGFPLKITINKDLTGFKLSITDKSGLRNINIFKNEDHHILQEKFYFLMQSLVDRQVFEQEEV